MAYTLKAMFNVYQKAMEDYSDPRVEDWLLMQSVFPVLCIIGAYLYIVLKCGPRFMQNRKAFNIDKILICYNVVQILACCYIFYVFCVLIIPTYDFWCEPPDFHSDEGLLIAKYVWWYFILKVVDLLDTIFFVLRKKQNQVSFLHVYHHAGMILATWTGTKFAAGGTGVYLGGYNVVVHAVMYTYYLLCVWDKKLKENMWWKKYLTQLQLIQFGLIMLQHIAIILQPNCKYPKIISAILVPQNLFMVVMFGDFYYKTYVKTSKSNVTAPKETENKKS